MDTDLNDIEKIQVVLASSSRQPAHDETANAEFPQRCESADGFSVASSYQQHLTPQAEFSIFDENSAESNADYVLVEDLEVNVDTAQVLNHTYKNMLLALRDQLTTLQLANRARQSELKREIEMLTEQEANKKSEKHRRKRFSLSYFGMPYFKDLNHKTPPENADTTQILSITHGLGLHNVAMFHLSKPFSKPDLRRLKLAMKPDAESFESKRLVKEREALENSLTDEMSEEERTIVQQKIEKLNRNLLHVSNLDHNKLFDVDPDKFDWESISINKFGRYRTAEQLKLVWKNSQRPGINNRTWSSTENQQLRELVKSSEDQVDWVEVANTVKNNRTVFECFRHYQEKYGPMIKKTMWTSEENNKIIPIVERYTDQTTREICWAEVRTHFPGRTKDQIYQHNQYIRTQINVDISPFTEAEDCFILEGINMGYNCADIALLIGKRNTRQISWRYRLLKNRKRILPPPWTDKENNMLLKMKSESELKRHNVNKKFPGRHFFQVFGRYHFLRVQSTTPAEYAEELRAKALEARKKRPKYANRYSKIAITLIRNMGMKPAIKTPDIYLGDKRKISSMIDGRSGKRKKLYAHLATRTVKRREKILKDILRPLMNLNPRRARKLTFAGDGREYGIIMSSLYRLLNCSFTLAPEGELSEDELFDLGIQEIHHLTFTNLLKLVVGIAPSAVEFDKIYCLPPSLTSLAGFRGILLHRKYLERSASLPYEPPQAAAPTLIEIEGTTEEPVAGPSREHQPIESVTIEDEPHEERASAPTSENTINVSLREMPTESMDCDEPSTFEKNVDVDQNVTLSSKDDAGQAKATNLEASTSQNEEGSEEEEDEPVFGNAEADSLLLSRMISVFFWPGIMSTMYVPKALKQSVQRQIEEAEKTAEETPPPRKKSRLIINKEKRERMIEQMKQRRLLKQLPAIEDGERSEAEALATGGESSSAPVTPEPTPSKRKPRKRTPNYSAPVRGSDRVTRNSRSGANTPQEVEEIE